MLRKLLQSFFLLLTLCFSVASYGKSYIQKATFYQQDDTLFINVNSNINFPKNVKEAIKGGLEITFKYDFKIPNAKWYKLTAKAKISKSYRVSYTPVTNKFIVNDPVTLEKKKFNTLEKSRLYMQNIKAFPLMLLSQLNKETQFLNIRFHMSNANLPTYIRIDRLFNDNWDVDSDWREFKIP